MATITVTSPLGTQTVTVPDAVASAPAAAPSNAVLGPPDGEAPTAAGGAIGYQQIVDGKTGTVSTTAILYTSPSGHVWTVPEGHRFWSAYQQWLAAGNKPTPPASTTKT